MKIVDIFGKKAEKESLVPRPQYEKKKPKGIYQLFIRLSNGDGRTFTMASETMPHSYRKLMSWYILRDSKSYLFSYNVGCLAFNREDVKFIDVTKIQG